MKYKYNQANLVDAFKNLAEWAANLDPKTNKQVIDATWDKLDVMMTETQMEFDDIFGTEGYEFRILGKD